MWVGRSSPGLVGPWKGAGRFVMNTISNGEPHVPSQWQKHQSAHFAFWFMPDSPVENNVTVLASSLEAIRDATVKALELEDLPQEQVQVYLSDMPLSEMPYGWHPKGRQGDGQVYEVGDGQVLAVYLSDAPGGVLERALVELLLTSSLGIRADRSAMLIDGLLGYVTQQIEDYDPAELNTTLVRLQGEGRRIALADFLRGPTGEAKPLYHQVVTSFITFLITTYGSEPFKRFAREFNFDAPDHASEAAYRKLMASLEKEWLVNLQQTQPSAPDQMQLPAPGQMQSSALGQMQTPAPGVMWFFRGALTYLRPYWAQEVLILLATVVGAAFAIVLPLAFGWVIDALTEGDYSYLRPIVLGVVALFVLQVPAMLGQAYLSARVGANVMNDLQYKMFDHLQRLSTDFYFRTRPGDITSRFTNDLALLNLALTQMLPMLATLALTFVGSLITLFFLQGLLALIVVLALPLFLILPARLGVRAARVTHEVQQNRADRKSVV